MYWSTTDSIAGHKVIKHGTIFAAFGRTGTRYCLDDNSFKAAMAEATSIIKKDAENKGYNAIVGLKFQYFEGEVFVMGTAVLVDQDEQQ